MGGCFDASLERHVSVFVLILYCINHMILEFKCAFVVWYENV